MRKAMWMRSACTGLKEVVDNPEVPTMDQKPTNSQSHEQSYWCKGCGHSCIHALNVHPATGKFFSNCGMVNHFMRVCQQRRKESRNSSLNMVQANWTRAGIDTIGSATAHVAMLDLIKVNLSIQGRDINVMMLPDMEQTSLQFPSQKWQGLVLKGCSNLQKENPFRQMGQAFEFWDASKMWQVTLGSCKMSVELMVIEGLKWPILSQQALKDLKLIHIDFPFCKVENLEDQQTIDLGHGRELNNVAKELKSSFWGQDNDERRPIPHWLGTRSQTNQLFVLAKSSRTIHVNTISKSVNTAQKRNWVSSWGRNNWTCPGGDRIAPSHCHRAKERH